MAKSLVIPRKKLGRSDNGHQVHNRGNWRPRDYFPPPPLPYRPDPWMGMEMIAQPDPVDKTPEPTATAGPTEHGFAPGPHLRCDRGPNVELIRNVSLYNGFEKLDQNAGDEENELTSSNSGLILPNVQFAY
uniref:Uncharacterized protein n=1 Tax=Glossina austeni TaxID=7395 RepID=A0A1A9UKY0_GLOAU